MQNHNKKTTKDSKTTKITNGKVAFILIVLLGLIAYFGINNYRDIFHFNQPLIPGAPQNSEPAEPLSDKTASQDNNEAFNNESNAGEDKECIIEKSQDEIETTQNIINDNTDPGSMDLEITRFGPDLDSETLVIVPETPDLSPYDQFEEQQPDLHKHTGLTKDKLTKKLNNYRQYIANANELIMLFLKKENYSDQLVKLKEIKLPEEIMEIINLMEEHLTLLDPEITSIKIFPINSTLIEKFIKVSKNNDSYKRRMELEFIINDQLKTLTYYIFSADLQEKFLEKSKVQNSVGNRHD